MVKGRSKEKARVGKAAITNFADLINAMGRVGYKTAYARVTKYPDIRTMVAILTPRHQIPGLVFDRGVPFFALTVVGRAPNGSGREAKYFMLCRCGKEVEAFKKNVLAGRTKSCGKCGYKASLEDLKNFNHLKRYGKRQARKNNGT